MVGGIGQVIERWVSQRFGHNPITKAFISSSLLFWWFRCQFWVAFRRWPAGGSFPAADQVRIGWHCVDPFYPSMGIGTLFSNPAHSGLSGELDAAWVCGRGFCERIGCGRVDGNRWIGSNGDWIEFVAGDAITVGKFFACIAGCWGDRRSNPAWTLEFKHRCPLAISTSITPPVVNETQTGYGES